MHALARGEQALRALGEEGQGKVSVEGADATAEGVAAGVLARQALDALVLVAGAPPKMATLAEYDWASFSRPWEVDVQMAFRWFRAALRASFGGRVVLVSSGAARFGSPLSGGYAGAKQTQRFIAQYAANEAERAGLGMQVQTLLPQLNPNTALGRGGIEAYAQRAGLTPEAFVEKRFGPQPLSPAIAGQAVVDLLTHPEHDAHAEFMLTGKGLHPLEK